MPHPRWISAILAAIALGVECLYHAFTGLVLRRVDSWTVVFGGGPTILGADAQIVGLRWLGGGVTLLMFAWFLVWLSRSD